MVRFIIFGFVAQAKLEAEESGTGELEQKLEARVESLQWQLTQERNEKSSATTKAQRMGSRLTELSNERCAVICFDQSISSFTQIFFSICKSA